MKKLLSEFLGTLLLVQAIIGSGIMAAKLSDDALLQLLINALAAVTTLALIITTFKKVSGAHFNPIVTLLSILEGKRTLKKNIYYMLAQCSGGAAGAILANISFGEDAFSLSTIDRSSVSLLVGEVIATFGLAFIVLLKPSLPELSIPLWIAGAYFFTSSTSFANPAVTFGRAFSDSPAGISPASLLPFVGAQLVGGLLAYIFVNQIFNRGK